MIAFLLHQNKQQLFKT